MNGRPKGSKNKRFHKWTDNQREFIKNNVKGITTPELTKMFNEEFETDLTVTQVKSFLNRNKLTNGVDCRFTKNHIPHNKGMKGVYSKGCEKTWFKKGQRSVNYRPVGSERVTVDGYTEIKVADPNVWKLKHRLKYIEYHGEIPKGYVVIFADKNKSNFSKDNLIAISRSQLNAMNKNNLIKDNIELTQIGINIANVLIKIGERKKSK